ncbi:MAG: hypothetical protein AAB384_00130 [Patescibacteria group bacterium]
MAKGDFDAPGELKRIEDANEGVNFDKKVGESVRRSTDVQTQIKAVVWCLLKEKIIWIVLGASAFAVLEILKELGTALIKKIP